MHVLLIEPDKLQAKAYAGALERRGWTVDCVTGAQSAVQSADEHVPDAVVLELQLTGHNGVEFLYEFRSYPEWLKIPIVLHTFVPARELIHAATLEKELGVRHILYKPTTTTHTLCEVVQRIAEA